MSGYLIRRLLASLVVLLGVTVIDFYIITLAPGDAVDYLAGTADVSKEFSDRLREEWGLDDPIHLRYFKWLGNVLRGNFGLSTDTQEPVMDRIGQRLGRTLLLLGTALIISCIIAVPVGVIAALKPRSVFDFFVSAFSLLGVSVPNFFLSLLAIYLFVLKWKLLPTSGMYTIGEPFSILDRVRHLILPASIVGLSQVGELSRYTRSSMRNVLGQDYVRTARAKGLPERIVLVRHGLRNALLPLITLLGLRVPWLLGGAIIVETIFAWPGMGLLTVQASDQRDYAVLMGAALVSATMGIIGNLTADLLYSRADPRIRV